MLDFGPKRLDFLLHIDMQGLDLRSGRCLMTRVFLRDVLVLAAATPAGKAGGIGSNSDSAVQLRLTDAQSQRFEWMYANGKNWRLEIRPATDAKESPRTHDDGTTLLKDGVGIR